MYLCYDLWQKHENYKNEIFLTCISHQILRNNNAHMGTYIDVSLLNLLVVCIWKMARDGAQQGALYAPGGSYLTKK